MKRRWLILTLVALSLGVMSVSAQIGGDFTNEFLESPSGRAFIQTYGALKSGYLNDVDDEAIIQGAIEGMISALDDPFSYYLTPKLAAREVEQRSGSYEGIGAVLTPRNRQTGKGVEILTVYQGGPASSAGLQRGDVFLSVEGAEVGDLTTSEVADLVRGPGGTPVTLLMRRPGVDDPLEFVITRDAIAIVDVQSTLLPDNVGYISISGFRNQRLYDQLVEQLDKLEQEGITSLILDLRDNGGGLLTQGILVADEFLSSGNIVFQRARGVTQRIASADAPAFDMPMVVLVNENSASASEIVAGALQENGRALVIGEKTFGKGVAQSVVSLSDGGQLAYLSFEWLTPKRNSIHEAGITPDIFAPDTRFPNVISLEGRGADPGQSIEIVIDGEVAASAVAGDDGTFEMITLGPSREISSVQGEALVDLDHDSALQVAFQTVLDQVSAAAN